MCRHLHWDRVVLRCQSQPPGTGRTGRPGGFRRRAAAIIAAVALALMIAAAPAHAQIAPTPSPTPTPAPPVPGPPAVNHAQAAGNTTLNLGSSLLQRLGNQASGGFARSLRTTPGGGGAAEAQDAPRY